MVEQSLRQVQSQQLQQVLAPHLRQSLEILQVPVLELRTLIRQEMQTNPTLEEPAPSEAESIEVEPGTAEVERELNEEFEQEFERLAQMDEEWTESFRQNRVVQSSGSEAESRRQFMLDSITEPVSLQEHLMDQLQLTDLSEAERKVGEMLIGSMDDSGYLSTTLEEFSAATGVDPETLRYVLTVIQDFDPIGVGAQDLAECLILQLRRMGKPDDAPECRLVRSHLDLLAAHKHAEAARAMEVSEEELRRLADLVSTLDPRPGLRFSSEQTTYVVPEVTVQKVEDRYTVLHNNEYIPRVRISKHYRRLMRDPDTPEEVRTYIREKIRAGSLLVKSIDQRQRTILRIAQEIVRVQQDFFEHGLSRLKPLTMAQVAEVLGIHETTVSRAASGKYMQTPAGFFEMKYFFTTGLRTADGGQVSNESVKDAIARMVADENASRPLSDAAIEKQLKAKGVRIARRTVAKYREQMNIPPSHLRKRMA
jgi:RNA polymerase sigma-54 factor